MSSGVLAVENEFEFSFWFLLSLIISDVICTVFICQLTLHNQLNFLLTWNYFQQEQTPKHYTHPCFGWSWLPQRCTFSKLSWKVWVQMRVTQRIICCWRKVFSTQSGTAANCSSWSKGSLFTCLALKWGVVQTHMELSCPFRFRWVWVSPTRLLTGRGCYKQERLQHCQYFSQMV